MPLYLCLNAGSSSLKFALFEMAADGEEPRHEGKIEGVQGEAAFERLFAELPHPPDAIVHRVVHGGADYTEPARIDDAVVAVLKKLTDLAPEHQPGSIAGIEAARRAFPDLPHVACFDTAFHQRMPEVAKRLPLPEKFWEAGIRRYGFHGLSYEYLVATLGDEIPVRTVLAHLGNGSSLAAVWNGHPVETTMGFTPSGGVMMGTRSGDLDPGVLLHLQRSGVTDLGALINEQSGLMGVSGFSSDMRKLLEAEAQGHEGARRAIELYVYTIRKHIGSLAAVLGGVELIVFTGGIGENRAEIRERILGGLSFLQAESIVIPTNEALMMARQAHALLRL